MRNNQIEVYIMKIRVSTFLHKVLHGGARGTMEIDNIQLSGNMRVDDVERYSDGYQRKIISLQRVGILSRNRITHLRSLHETNHEG